jgi:hypothetical protein
MSLNNNSKDTTKDPSSLLMTWVLSILEKVKTTLQQKAQLLILACVLGGVLGLGYSWIKSTRYKSEITFMVEESKNLGGGVLSSIGGQMGMDLGSLTGSSANSIIAGDNMLQLLTSNTMMAQCLKTPFSADSNYSIADRYADVYGLRAKWANDSKIGRSIFFAKPDKDVRLQDSLLKTIIKKIELKELLVSKPEKKLSFFKVVVNTKDELLSKIISERIIKIVADFYVNAKTSRQKTNVARLEKRTDSIYSLLNERAYSAIRDTRLMLNLNPADVNAPVVSEISQRDKVVLSSTYMELMKNLEAAKLALLQETPTIQITDKPVLPLEKEEVKWYEGLLVGMAAPVLLMLVFFLL